MQMGQSIQFYECLEIIDEHYINDQLDWRDYHELKLQMAAEKDEPRDVIESFELLTQFGVRDSAASEFLLYLGRAYAQLGDDAAAVKSLVQAKEKLAVHGGSDWIGPQLDTYLKQLKH